MNPITSWLVAAAFLFLCVIVTYYSTVSIKHKNEEIERLKKELEKQKYIAQELFNHTTQVAQIEKESAAIQEEINGAQSNEEITNIIASLVNNNNKLCKQAKGRK